MPKNYYLLLGLSPGASLEEVKTAYRRRAKELHPDYSGQSNEPFQEIQEAYSILGNPSRKREYDHRLEEIRSAAPLANAGHRIDNRSGLASGTDEATGQSTRRLGRGLSDKFLLDLSAVSGRTVRPALE
jgi:curved DNA-binding protein CbpA